MPESESVTPPTPETTPLRVAQSGAGQQKLGAAWDRLGWARFPLVLWIVTRAGLLLCSRIALSIAPTLAVRGGPTHLAEYPALAGLCRWDCGWFDQLARQGYQTWIETNFWPLYPLLARATSYLGLPIEFGLLFWSNLACLGAYLLIFRLFSEVADEQAARWGLTLLAAYPFAYFHAAGYPESLMLLSTSAATLLALRKRHLSAGVVLGLGVLARHVTIIGGAALLAAQLRERGQKPLRFLFHRDFLGLLAPFAVLGVYPLYCYLRFGDPFSMMHARQAGWGDGAWMSALAIYESSEPTWHTYLIFASVLLVGSLGLLWRKAWAELAAYGILFMLIIFVVGGLGLGRYSASCWPAFLPLGAFLAKRPNLQVPVAVVFALFQGLFFYLWAHQHPIL